MHTPHHTAAHDAPDAFLMRAHVLRLEVRLSPVMLSLSGQPTPVLELDTRLSFARKPANLSELGGGTPQTVYVFKRIEMHPLGFDAFARNLLREAEWLKGLSMALPWPDARACVMVVSAGRPLLFIDTQGYSYARCVAKLG
jgi:hypothetical protein